MRVEEHFKQLTNNPPNGASKNGVFKKYKHFPSKLITKDSDNVPHFIIGTGGDGKTFNELREAIDLYLKGGLYNQSGFIYPSKIEVEEQIRNKNLFDKLLSEKDTAKKYGDFIEKLTYKGDWVYYDDKPFIRLYAISMHYKYKPQDHTRIGNIWMDEFQRENYIKNEAFKIQDLIATIKRKKEPKNLRVVFTANAISLASPILQAFRVNEIDDKKIINLIKTDDNILIGKLWYWKRPYEDVKQQNNNDVWMSIFEQSGYADYRYKNEFKNDNMSNIIKLEPNEVYFKHYFLLEIEDFFVDIYMIPAKYNSQKVNLYYAKINYERDKDKVEYAIDKDKARDNVPYSVNISNGIARKIIHNRMWYENIAVKEAIRRTVKTFF